MKQSDLGQAVDVELEGIQAGLWGGGLLLLSEMVVASQAVPDGGFSTPLVLAASLVMGHHAFEVPIIFSMLAGLAVHISMSAGIGFVFGLAASAERLPTRMRSVAQGLIGALFGAGVWLLTLVGIAPVFYPWIADFTPIWVQLLLHVVAFGLPMGWVFASLEQRRGGRAMPV